MPARWDEATNMWIPTLNLTPAARWGELVVLFQQNVSRAATSAIVQAMREKMDGFTEEDCLVAVGDPALLASASCIAARKCGGLLRILRWDRMARDYNLLELRP
jgi:hypothetical protein